MSICVDPDLVLRNDDFARFSGGRAGNVSIIPLQDIPLVQPGDDIAQLVWSAAMKANVAITDGDILVLAQKIISKSENAYVNLASVVPSTKARELAVLCGKDERLMQVILDEAADIIRVSSGVVIAEHRSGFLMANAGIDASNVENGDDRVLKLPQDADESAKRVSNGLSSLVGTRIPVLINDSWGRPWRQGSVGHCVGLYGFPAVWDRRGEEDLFGRPLKATQIGLGDEIAAAASLVMGAAGEGIPAIILRGFTVPTGVGKAADLIRPHNENLFR